MKKLTPANSINLVGYTDEERATVMTGVQKACIELLQALDIDTTADPNTVNTSIRMAKMLVNEVMWGRFYPMPNITSFPNTKNIDCVYTVGPCKIRSLCSHHFVPIIGDVWMGILPDKSGRILGLSKFQRVSDWVFSRPQIQEEATHQLGELLLSLLGEVRGLAITVRASHLCTIWRGVREENISMVTSFLHGVFKYDEASRKEYISLIQGQGF